MAKLRSLMFAYRRSLDQDAQTPVLHPVVVVGAGPVGLSLAIDLAQRGQAVVLVDNDCRLATGSRAICFAKNSLEMWDKLGVGQQMVDKGIPWQVGRVFFGDQQVYQFDLLAEAGHERPAFINLQQYYVEEYLVNRAQALSCIDLRWQHEVVDVVQNSDSVSLTIETPEGRYLLKAQYVAACDGARSSVRRRLGQTSQGRTFQDRFLIADVRMNADFPTERWFWFDPPFHRNQSVLLHRQPDNVWRIDFQLGWDADPEIEKKPENIKPRVQALLGQDVQFELEWASVYSFACSRMERFVHDRIIFLGDAAHGVSPFGARGANSGVQDAENLAWKLDFVLRGKAPATLLETYGQEREYAADDNILQSTRSTDFITPKSEISRLFRDAVLDLARHHAFARRLVNSGRLSTPTTLRQSLLQTPDEVPDQFQGAPVVGAVAVDAPMTQAGQPVWLLRQLGNDFCLLVFGEVPVWTQNQPFKVLCITDLHGLAAKRYDAQKDTAYLIRPDRHIAARWRSPSLSSVRAALQRACGQCEEFL